MAKKKEEEVVVLTKADFDQAVKELGGFLGEELSIEGTTCEECLEEFMNAVENVPPNDEGNLPDIVVTVFNTASKNGADAFMWEEATDPEEAQEEQGEVVSELPKIERRGRPKGSAKKKEEKVMKEKSEEKKVVEKKAVAPVKKEVVKKEVKKEVVKKEKVAKTPKTKAEIGRYGHRKGSTADFMDDMLWKGVSLDEAIANITKSLGKTKERAKGMFLAHVYYLPAKKNIPIDKPKAEGGKYKAKKAEA